MEYRICFWYRMEDSRYGMEENLKTRDPRGIQSDAQSANWGLVSIPTSVCADTLGSAPE